MMLDMMKVLIVTVAALGVTGAMVIWGGDTTIAVPPPESVTEQFARHIATRRYDRALQLVDDHSGITLTSVRLGGDSLHRRAGNIDHVEGEPGSIKGSSANAAAVLRTQRAGQVRYQFRLERRDGVWKIVRWEEAS